ncbi:MULTISPECIES: EAL and HDOD domain-containing protein [unclassified Herbaspirillum]|uniref:EAL and HDOD domain-containing protein n=1 Tax=unclassified Herbaspirillum TaxID=2624150 RepID=UPI0011536DDE|nr:MULTISPECIES: HDOD domain-containing protein [unclassified Herbaspirillum]TQK04331.1 EAL and modified HD-GYP domain-containing signal transduction protein [Herbaspirillum sp. SJZ130]TQK09884.1 EAL and modified HD-GYP domain-containing signal transduction protein [Herbaspirillum sp. SJZ106]
MAVQDKSVSFPLVFLQPVADVHHVWTALSLHISPIDEDGSALLSRLFNEFKLHDALGGLACIIPVRDPAVFAPEFAHPIPQGQIALRVPVEHCVDPGKIDALDWLYSRGFSIIADGLPAQGAAMFPFVESLALDASVGRLPDAAQWLHRLRGPHLAENIGDAIQFDRCRTEGFRWFAGDYALHPDSRLSQKNSISRARLLKLLGLVARDADAGELESLLKQDPALSYQLFKLVSSAAFGFSAHITNFTQAINLLGRRQLQRWLQLLLYARFPGDESANPLLPRAAARAAMMESMAQRVDCTREELDRAFITGMFSLLDILLGMPLQDIIEPLKLPADIVNALTARTGRLGKLLDVVERSEYSRIPLRHADLEAAGLDARIYCECLLEAFGWATRVSTEA